MTAPYRKPSDNPHINQAVEALKRAQPMLELLPNVDFTVRLDHEAEAYIAAQRRSKKLWLLLGLALGIPVTSIVLLRLCT